jgi:hypothetical protein
MSESADQVIAQYMNLDSTDLTAMQAEVGAGRSLGDLVATVVDHEEVIAVLTTPPEVPATPTEQDIVDALVALGLVTQAEAE